MNCIGFQDRENYSHQPVNTQIQYPPHAYGFFDLPMQWEITDKECKHDYVCKMTFFDQHSWYNFSNNQTQYIYSI